MYTHFVSEALAAHLKKNMFRFGRLNNFRSFVIASWYSTAWLVGLTRKVLLICSRVGRGSLSTTQSKGFITSLFVCFNVDSQDSLGQVVFELRDPSDELFSIPCIRYFQDYRVFRVQVVAVVSLYFHCKMQIALELDHALVQVTLYM